MKKTGQIFAVCLAFALALCLAACGSSEAPDPDSLKGEKVADAQAFAAAFDLSDSTNLTFKMRKQYEDVVDGQKQYVDDYTYYYMLDGDKMCVKREMIRPDGENITEYDEKYYTKEGDKYYKYEYTEETSKWYKWETREENWRSNFELLTQLNENSVFLPKITYDDCEYDNEKKAYVYFEGEDSFKEEWQIKIVDGKIAVIIEIKKGRKYTFQYYDYGKTSVSVPDAELME